MSAQITGYMHRFATQYSTSYTNARIRESSPTMECRPALRVWWLWHPTANQHQALMRARSRGCNKHVHSHTIHSHSSRSLPLCTLWWVGMLRGNRSCENSTGEMLLASLRCVCGGRGGGQRVSGGEKTEVKDSNMIQKEMKSRPERNRNKVRVKKSCEGK